MRAPLWLFAALVAVASVTARAEKLAERPPMGWNSWDAYGFTLDERAFRDNVDVLRGLKQFGWLYAVIDEGWYMGNPEGTDRKTREYQIDANGRLVPAVNRFPSADRGAGLKQLSAWVHQQQLKIGIHIVRGIPKGALEAGGMIEGSRFHIGDAADPANTCPWDDGNFGVRDNAAGQAYYDSVIKLYSQWGIDFLKVDCISNAPYRLSEIRQIATAIKRSGRPMVLSLSPGPTDLSHASEVAGSSQMWRISNDIWDGWSFKGDFPIGIVTAFDSLARWNGYAKPGAWPDADMLPLGDLSPHPGYGVARSSGLTKAETQTMFLLWAVGRSPLILGSNLTHLDPAIRALVTNRKVIDLNQGGWSSHPLVSLPPGFENARLWLASKRGAKGNETVLAIFNAGDGPLAAEAEWRRLGIQPPHRISNLITGDSVGSTDRLTATLAPHASVAYRLD